MGNLRTVLAASAVALLLAACTDAAVEHSESASPSASVSVSASATASPSPGGELTTEELLALLPPGAELPDVQGAIVTAEFFVSLLGKIYLDLDTEVWEALAAADCDYCTHKVGEVADLAESSWRAEGGEVTVSSSAVKGTAVDDGYVYVLVPASVADLYVVSATGERRLAEAASNIDVGLQMVLEDGIWRVNGVTIEDR